MSLADRLAEIRVLVADDSPSMRRLLQECLYELGVAEVLQAKDGRDAVMTLAREKPQLIVTDVNMPEANGLEIIRAVRAGAVPGLPRGTPTIVLTGHTDGAVLTAALLLDVDGFLIKPVRPADIAARIARALDHPLEPRAARAYAMIDLPHVETWDDPKGLAVYGGWSPPGEEMALPETAQLVPVAAVPPGARTADWLKTANGGYLLPPGAVLTERLLIHLADLAAMELIEDAIPLKA